APAAVARRPSSRRQQRYWHRSESVMVDPVSTRCGLVALVGRPNVGKSTLLNHLVGQKVSITSRKPQTTRQRILGIKTVGAAQIVFVDTPGFHQGIDKAINRLMNRTISSVVGDVDLILFLTDRLHLLPEDEVL